MSNYFTEQLNKFNFSAEQTKPFQSVDCYQKPEGFFFVCLQNVKIHGFIFSKTRVDIISRWDTLTNKVNENNKNIAKTLSYKKEYIK